MIMDVQFKNRKIPILMYHSISQHAAPKFKAFAVPPPLFAEHMAYLHQHDFTPITVTQLVHSLAQGEPALPEHPVILTFDDGFADFFTHALPILRRYGFVATLYVSTGFINGTSSWLQREEESTRPMLTWEQLAEISAYGIECGAHSHSHPQLDTLPLTVTLKEIVHSKEVLEEHLKLKVTSFAYPFGYYTEAVRQQVRDTGYTSACAVKFALSSVRAASSDPFALARLMVRPNTDIDRFAALLRGQEASLATRTYLRVRTPAWQWMRRGSVAVTRYLRRGALAQ
ncbi:MAG: hypothetical protein NVSMB33_17290 [Ktedonobacteraceae bacterium]